MNDAKRGRNGKGLEIPLWCIDSTENAGRRRPSTSQVRSLGRTQPCWHLDFRPSVSMQNWEKIKLCCFFVPLHLLFLCFRCLPRSSHDWLFLRVQVSVQRSLNLSPEVTALRFPVIFLHSFFFSLPVLFL